MANKHTHTPEEILAELRGLVSEAESMVGKTLDTSDSVVATLRARYEAAQERLTDAYGEARRKAAAGVRYADETIRESPYKSIAIAATAGLVVGLIVAMRKHRSIAALVFMLLFAGGGLSLSAQRGQGRGMSQAMMMSGTYDLESTRGDNAQRAAETATRNLPPGQRDRAYQDLMARLQPPATIAIERAGRTFTISSSSGPRASFDADGRTRNEIVGRQTIATRAELVGDRLTVSSRGNRATDFLVTFEPIDRGDGLLVTRQMDNNDLRTPVVIRSYYHRVAAEPRWDIYRDAGGPGPGPDRRPRAFVIPEGTRINAVLDTQISTRSSRDGERFTMTVQGPPEYRDARIDGVIQRVQAYGGGHAAEMRVDFDTIRLRNGQSAEFDAVLSSVRTPGGATMRINSENVPNSNQAQRNVEGGAVGAALGAIIGAIAGGGKGAAIGAIAGGAGGVIIAQNDRDQYLDLPPGTQVTFIVTSSGRIR